MLSTRERIALALAALVLLVMFGTPLWRITLEAPQYPEGLGLRIMLSTVEGQKPNDLENINNLNHYIGMKRIVPDSIPELRIMPWAVGLLIALGLVAAGTGRAWMLHVWVGLFLVLALAGLVDFWLWEYDYGHNLDLEHAIIKIPGMSYQPPLIGSKQLLNFRAHSWPGIGGWAAFASLATGLVLTASRLRGRGAAPVLALAVLAAGCGRGPEPFVFGEDTCAHCRMTITDPAYATQVVSGTGRAYKLDSVECLLRFTGDGASADDGAATRWVTAVDSGDLVEAGSAWFIRSDAIRSPMGGGIAAFGSREAAQARARELDGEVLDWAELQRRAAATALGGHRHPG